MSDPRFQDFYVGYCRWLSLAGKISTLGGAPMQPAHSQTVAVFGRVPAAEVEIEAAHVVDGIRSLASIAGSAPDTLDYPRVAKEELDRLEQLAVRIQSSRISPQESDAYIEFLNASRCLLTVFGNLPVQADGHLGFRAGALEAFRFLRDEYGFWVADSSPIVVRFSSIGVAVAVEYSPQFPPLSITVTLLRVAGSPAFSLDDFAYSGGLGLAFPYERFNMSDRAGLQDFLREAAELLRTYGGGTLRGDDTVCLDFVMQSRERERLYCAQMAATAQAPPAAE